MNPLIPLALLLVLAGCAAPVAPTLSSPSSQPLRPWQKPYSVYGVRYQPLLDHQGFTQSGVASWYGADFHGKKTSNGEIYDMYDKTAAHKVLPLGVHVRVRNLDNGLATVVRVNDRGPFVKKRIIDLSYAVAKELGVVGPGTARVQLEALGYPVQEAGVTVYRQIPPPVKGSFAVQLASFGERENALRLSDQLQTRFGGSRVKEAVVNNRRFYRVWAGQFDTLEEAHRGRVELAQGGYGEGTVVALD